MLHHRWSWDCSVHAGVIILPKSMLNFLEKKFSKTDKTIFISGNLMLDFEMMSEIHTTYHLLPWVSGGGG